LALPRSAKRAGLEEEAALELRPREQSGPAGQSRRRSARRARRASAKPAEPGVALASAGAGPTYWTRTLAVPLPCRSSAAPAAFDRSIRRSSTNGPRSLRRTTTVLPFSRLVTRGPATGSAGSGEPPSSPFRRTLRQKRSPCRGRSGRTTKQYRFRHSWVRRSGTYHLPAT
jgi:hypothetical protein